MRRALVLSLLVGCGGGDDPPPGGPVTIGPAGGTIESEDGVLRMEVPPGAIAEETVFEIIPVAAGTSRIPAAVVVGNVYDIQPEGTTFAVPARLSWTYLTTPANAIEGTARKLISAMSASQAGVFESALRTDAELRGDGSLVATNEIPHLSEQALTVTFVLPDDELFDLELGRVSADLRGGEHFVELPWSASEIRFETSSNDIFNLEAEPRGDGVVVPMNDPNDWNNLLLLFELGYKTESFMSGVDIPPTMPRWKCTAAGSGKVRLGYGTTVRQVGGDGVSLVSTLSFEEEVTCVIREEKPEYLQQRATLTEARVETITTPANVSKDLATTQGSFGYFLHIPAGQTIEVCVSTTGSAAVNYFPHFPPGFNFVDTQPGCTQITSMDPELPNDVLIVVSGSGTITVTATVVEP
jgi:hypothetical protein